MEHAPVGGPGQTRQRGAQILMDRKPTILAILGSSALGAFLTTDLRVVDDAYDVSVEVDVGPPQRGGLADPQSRSRQHQDDNGEPRQCRS